MNKREYSEMVIGNRTVDELLHLYLTDQITDNPTYVAVTALLRKAVIREASVGTVYAARDGADGYPEFRFRCAESLAAVSNDNVCQLCRELIPERQYVLIPSNLAAKETP